MNESLPSFLLVDGNNIIHAWPDLLQLHRKRHGLAHRELITRLSEYQGFTGERLVVVFDGRKGQTTEERDPGGLQIFYSGGDRTADEVIERLALKYADIYRISVATDDRTVQDVVVAAGGEEMSSLALWDRLQTSESQMKDWLKKRRRKR